MESVSKTSGPPPASSWATPPEFYADENSVTRSVCRLLRGLGYTLHTPAELYGSREAALGAEDEDWLPKVGQRGWTVLGRDLKIYERPGELEAYRQARIKVFLLPGEALAAELARLVEVNLAQMCAISAGRQAGSWRLTNDGPVPYDTRGRPQRRGSKR
jgi:hypothetical protein